MTKKMNKKEAMRKRVYKNASLPDTKIAPTGKPGSVNLNSQIGILSDERLPSVKRVDF